ncbi:MAG: DUF4440 domain-containing protein [Comamonadaceae bacterium]|nr:DUF4440 domain-containing protein [Comamonadaceae bacterium]
MMGQGTSTDADGVARVEAARQRWANAFNAADLRGLLTLYDPAAVLWGTTSPVLIDTPEGIATYFERTFSAQPAPRVHLGEARIRLLGDEVALCSGAYTLYLSGPAGEARTLPARFSLAYRRLGDRWLIMDHHSSVSP